MSDSKNKPALDEQTFAKLLEAAYVLQEHNREMRQIEQSLELHSERLREQEAETQEAYEKSLPRPAETRPDTDYTRTLAEIVEAQHQIQIRHLQSDEAMAVIAERAARIIGGTGAGIGVLEGKMIRYRAGAGSSALPTGSEVPLERAICAICVRTGQVLRTPDVNTEFLFDPETCHPRGILSLVAVPIYHDGNIVGALEVYFDQVQGFVEQDVHTCRLMAGLVTETIGRSSESALKKSMAEERSSMMAAIEQLRPNLLPLAEGRPETPNDEITAVARTISCWKCGNRLIAEEQFCGTCGSPRAKNEVPEMPGRLAGAWNDQQEVPGNSFDQARAYSEPIAGVGSRLSAVAREMNLAPDASVQKETEVAATSRAQEADAEAMQTALSIAAKHRDVDLEDAAVVLEKAKVPEGDWRSAAKARDFLENLSDNPPKSARARFWRSHRGDFYLAVAVILVLAAIRWGMMTGSPVSATAGNPASSNAARNKTPADANLSVFDRLLISLGLAEAPEETTEDKGNPDAQVWIDVHTALYYCPGSDLYGKTEKGRFASQRDAQLDQFEPALRKACE